MQTSMTPGSDIEANDGVWTRYIKERFEQTAKVSNPYYRDAKVFMLLISIVFIALADFIYINDLNEYIFRWFNNAGLNYSPNYWACVTFLGDALPVLAIILITARSYPRLLWVGFIAAIYAGLITQFTKRTLDVLRPYGVLDTDSFNTIGIIVKYHSFPSGHTLTIFTLIGCWLFLVPYQAVRLMLVGLAFYIGTSRMVVGAHWPTDILIGAAGGLVCAWLGTKTARHYPWGWKPQGFFFLLLLYTAVACSLFFHDGGYPNASWVARFISLFAIYLTLKHFIYTPFFAKEHNSLSKA